MSPHASQRVFLVDGARTPFLKARGGPGPFTPVDLAVQCGRPLLARQPFDRTAFDLVILGCVNVIADEMNPSRVAALRSVPQSECGQPHWGAGPGPSVLGRDVPGAGRGAGLAIRAD